MAGTQIVETYFKAGKDAHDAGVLRYQSPYNRGSSRYAEWVSGWDAALKANHGDENALTAGAEYVKLDDPKPDIEMSEDLMALGDEPAVR